MGSLFVILIILMTHKVKSDVNSTEHDHYHHANANETEHEGQYLLVTLRDLLYHYTDDLYDFIKTNYGDTYDPVEEVTAYNDTEDEQETVTATATTLVVENKYKSFEECRSWWKDTRYI